MSEQASTALRAGAAAIAITPPVGSSMQGYHFRYADGVSEPLIASAFAMGGPAVEWLLLSIDAIGVDGAFTARVRGKIARDLRLSPSAITIACSHTHSGPATLPQLGAVAADHAYLVFLEQQLAKVAVRAAENLQLVRWRFGVTSLSENVNRRVRIGNRVELGVNPEGPVDSRLRVIRIDRAVDEDYSASPLALIVHYACHATSSAGVPLLSPDWPGAMRTALQQSYTRDGVQPVICFLQGCAGNLTHRVGRDRQTWPEHFEKETWAQSQTIGRLAAAAALCASERSVRLAAQNLQIATKPLTLSFRDFPGSELTEIQVVRIGPRALSSPALWFIGLPGEPFTEYSTLLGRHFHRRLSALQDAVLVTGYANDCVGYLCTPKALREGGYEAAAAHYIYNRPAAFSEATQGLVLDCSIFAAEKLIGRISKPPLSKLTAGLRRMSRW